MGKTFADYFKEKQLAGTLETDPFPHQSNGRVVPIGEVRTSTEPFEFGEGDRVVEIHVIDDRVTVGSYAFSREAATRLAGLITSASQTFTREPSA